MISNQYSWDWIQYYSIYNIQYIIFNIYYSEFNIISDWKCCVLMTLTARPINDCVIGKVAHIDAVFESN